MDTTPSIERGQAFMKAVVKASLYGLFAIGVRSQANIDKFVVAFTENLDKNLQILGITPMVAEAKPAVPTTKLEEAKPVEPRFENPSKVEELHLMPKTLEALRKAKITTVDQLITEMQKRDLKEIKGIDDKAVAEIREAVAKWEK